MCNQFNNAVDDLMNQIDTTDLYIENYLPFRTIKEMVFLMSECFDFKTMTKIKAFEARRIKEMYTRLLTTKSKVPDFKNRLRILTEKRSKLIPGFSEVQRERTAKELEIPLPTLDDWFEQSHKKLNELIEFGFDGTGYAEDKFYDDTDSDEPSLRS